MVSAADRRRSAGGCRRVASPALIADPSIIQSSDRATYSPSPPTMTTSSARRDGGDELVAAGAGDLGVGTERRQRQHPAPLALGFDDPARIGQQGRLDHVVVRDEGLHQDPPARRARDRRGGRPARAAPSPAPRRDTAAPASRGRSRGTPPCRRVRPGAVPPRCRRRPRPVGGRSGPSPVTSDRRTIGRRLEFLPQPRDPRTQVGEPSGPTVAGRPAAARCRTEAHRVGRRRRAPPPRRSARSASAHDIGGTPAGGPARSCC